MKKIIFFLIFVLSINVVYGICSDLNNTVAYYSFDIDCESDSSINSYDGTNSGASNVAGGIINNACDFESTQSDKVYINDITTGGWVSSGGTICLWVKIEDLNGAYAGALNFGYNHGSTFRKLGLQFTDTNKLQAYVHDSSNSNAVTSSTSYNGDTDFHFLCMMWDSDEHINNFYIDNVSIGSDDSSIADVSLSDLATIGAWYYQGSYIQHWDGLIDEVGIWDYELNSTNVNNLYNLGSGCNPYSIGSGTTPNLVINTNMINNTLNYNSDNITIYYNGTIINNSELYNCTLLNNITELTTNLNMNLSNNNFFIYNFTNTSEDFYFNINCTNNNATNITGFYKYSVDIVNPIIQTTFINNSNYTQDDTLNMYFNFSDNNLYAYNITVLDSNNNIWESKQYLAENLTVTFAENSTSFTVSDLGNFTIFVEAWDSHTLKVIDDYKIKDLENGIEIEDDINIYHSSIKKIELEKNLDRYNIEIEFNDNEFTQYIIVKGKDLRYLKDSNYKIHLLDFNSKKWLDFESISNYNYSIEKINESEYLITLNFEEKQKIIMFNSIGDLNYIGLKYYYSVIDSETLNTQLLQAILSELQEANTHQTNIWEAIELLGYLLFVIIFFALAVKYKLAILINIGGFGFIFMFFKAMQNPMTDLNLIYSIVMLILSITIQVFGAYMFVTNKFMEIDNTNNIGEKKGLKRIYN